jgi:preprotein translocase subunit SecD
MRALAPLLRFLRRRNVLPLLFVGLLLGLGLWALLDKEINLGFGDNRWRRGQSDSFLGLRLGLDLKGGTRLVYQANAPNVSEDDIEGVIDSIERRINAYGVTEPVIQRLGGDKVQVQLPGIRDVEEAKRLIGRPAILDFRECQGDASACLTAASNNLYGPELEQSGLNARWVPALARNSQGDSVHLTGKFLRRRSQVVAHTNTGLPQVTFEFNAEGGRMFEEVTQRNINRPLGIFLDGQLVSAPTVQAVIAESGVITGLSFEEARILSIQLNAGALPVPLVLIREETVDATLGEDSLDKSVVAGIIGLSMVLGFMVFNYRAPGILAGAALAIYTVIVLAVFKTIPVTLTLAGIAAFVLSVGMAVDANILIFERTKEELRAGKSLNAAIEAGFDRAWPSIRDSNVSTFITSGILFWFGERLGETVITGFSLTLFIGVAVSMFTAIFVTRRLLRVFVSSRFGRNLTLFRT